MIEECKKCGMKFEWDGVNVLNAVVDEHEEKCKGKAGGQLLREIEEQAHHDMSREFQLALIDNTKKFTAKAIVEWLENKHINVGWDKDDTNNVRLLGYLITDKEMEELKREYKVDR